MSCIRGGQWRSWTIAVVVSLAVFGIGCGDEGAGGGSGADEQASAPAPEGALRKALSYVPDDASVLIVLQTDLQRGPLARLDRAAADSPLWKRVKRDIVSDPDYDFETDVRPQLGNPAVSGAGKTGEESYGALQVKDPQALRKVIQRAIRTDREERLPSYKGALVTRDRKKDDEFSSRYSALTGDVLVTGDTVRDVKRGIDAGTDDGIPALAKKLPEGGSDVVLQAAGDGRRFVALVDDEDLRKASRAPWFQALGDLTAITRVEGAEVRTEFTQKTDRRPLTPAELPLHAGATAPKLHAPAEPTVLGLVDPDQTARFFEQLARLADPQGYREYQAGLGEIKGALGIDLHKDVLARIEDLSLAFGQGREASFVARLSEAKQPGDLPRLLTRLQPFISGVLEEQADGARLVVPKSGSDVWTVQRDGREIARFAIRGNAVIGTVEGTQLPSPGAGRPAPGEGAFYLKTDGRHLADLFRSDRDTFDADDIAAAADLNEAQLWLRADVAELTGVATVDLGP